MLVTTLALVALIALQAQYAVRSHRQAAEAVLRDYARLAAGEYARRLTAEVGFTGYFPIVTYLKRPEVASAPLPVPEAVAASGDAKLRQAAGLLRTFFRLGDGGNLETAGAPLSPETQAWIRAQLRSPSVQAGGELPFNALHGSSDGTSHTIIYTRVDAGEAEGVGPIAGFDVRLEALGPWFDRAMDRGPLLPASLSGGSLGNEVLALSLMDAGGKEIFRRGAPETNPLVIEARMGADYGGIFEGLTVRAAIEAGAAPRLLLGGIPRSQRPVPLVLLALTTGLVGASIYLMRRERALSALRSEFISRVSHELRTPLTQIRMFAETLLLGRVRSEVERRRSLEIMDQEARRLSHLVENILQFSRKERGSIRLAPRPLRLAPLVREIAETFGPMARSRGARLVIDLDEQPASLVDPEAMRQIFINLLDNALKYGPAGQEIRLTLSQEKGAARISVDDEGPGIPERDRKRIWERFQRLPRDEKAAIAGTGIGLTVVRELVSLHGGRVMVETGQRGGARFVVEMPLQEAIP